jgi:hypothetical protein
MRRYQLKLVPFCGKLAQNVDNDHAYIVTKYFFFILIHKGRAKNGKGDIKR